MPYGVPKELGGDSAKNTSRMDDCVSAVMKREPSYDQSRAIAVCKHSLGFTLANAARRGGAIKAGRARA